MGIREEEEMEAKEIHSIFDKIITENLPNLERELSIQVLESSKTPNRLKQNRTSSEHIIFKTTSTENRERILKAIREKNLITYKGKLTKITTNFSTETLKQEGHGVRYFEQ
jgi:hypothetical protein